MVVKFNSLDVNILASKMFSNNGADKDSKNYIRFHIIIKFLKVKLHA